MPKAGKVAESGARTEGACGWNQLGHPAASTIKYFASGSNAIAERFVRSIQESCLERMVLIGESSLHRATTQSVVRYHQERNHQGLGNKIIRPEFTPARKCAESPLGA